jgi:hypothetical protein
MMMVVFLPFFVVSTSAPLLQKWFTYTGHPAAKDPYFLYGASNLGSMLSLVFYPLLFERVFGLWDQSWIWTGGYIALLLLFFVCVGLVWNAPPTVHLPGSDAPAETPAPEPDKPQKKEAQTAITAQKPAGGSFSTRIKKGAKQKGKPLPSTPLPSRHVVHQPYVEVRSDVMTPWRRLRWIALAAVPSSLMLGIITYISTDVSPIAMFWVIPLALYLLSFILVFARWPVVWTRQPHTLMVIGFPIVFVCFLVLLIVPRGFIPYQQIFFAILTFFLTAMVCHGELARDRPSPKHLTEFYLMMSVGGMLGGVFNGLFAPVLFTWGLAELPIALALSCFLRPYTQKLAPVDKPILIVYCAILGLIVGWLLMGGTVGLFLGLVIGAIVGAVMNFDLLQTSGWSDNLLITLFPGLGEWFDEKGKELAAEAKTPEETPAEETKKKIIKHKAPPDYYVLNYTMDVALPILVLIFMLIVTQNRDAIFRSVGFVLQKTFGMTEGASSYARLVAVTLLPAGIPVLCALMFAFRPLRFGLTVAAILLLTTTAETTREGKAVLHRDRSYFGVLKIMRDSGEDIWDMIGPREYTIEKGQRPSEDLRKFYDLRTEELLYVNGAKVGMAAPYHSLMHGTTHHGLNYQTPEGLRRLATTYYHRKGPVGLVMERMNWFSASPRPADSSIGWGNWFTPEKGKYAPQNTYWADSRMPVTLAVAAAGNALGNPIPTEHLVALWTEPPYACVGLGTGTMASYARPLQHMTFYEIDAKIREFSVGEFNLPEGPGPYFNYVHDAVKRGAGIEIVMGDARLSMQEDVESFRQKKLDAGEYTPDLTTRDFLAYQHREHYYFAIELDAFSSDAIPVHLITREAFEQYRKKLTPQGILLVHTSNRHVELTKPVMDICKDLNLVYRVVNDHGEKGDTIDPKTFQYTGTVTIFSGERGHFQSEYVIVAQKEEDLPQPMRTPSTDAQVKAYNLAQYEKVTTAPYQKWQVPTPPGNRVWTDDYSDFIGVFRWGFGRGE